MNSPASTDIGLKTYLASLAFVLFSLTLIGLFWLATTPGQRVCLIFSYAAGLSMIFLLFKQFGVRDGRYYLAFRNEDLEFINL